MENQKRIESPNEWLVIADRNLKGSRICSENKLFDASVFWAHDSVEKSLKAFLVFNKIEGDKMTHDLQKLTNQCVRLDDSFKTLLPLVENINGWGEQVSYPDTIGSFNANTKQSQTAISTAERVYDFVKTKCLY